MDTKMTKTKITTMRKSTTEPKEGKRTNNKGAGDPKTTTMSKVQGIQKGAAVPMAVPKKMATIDS